MRSKRLALITSVALPFVAAAPAMATDAFGERDVVPTASRMSAPPLLLAQTPEELLILPPGEVPPPPPPEEEKKPKKQKKEQRNEPQQEAAPPPEEQAPPVEAAPPPPPQEKKQKKPRKEERAEPPAQEAAPPPPPIEAAPPPPPPPQEAAPPQPPAPRMEPPAAEPTPPPPVLDAPPSAPPVLEAPPAEPPVLQPPPTQPPVLEAPGTPPPPRLNAPGGAPPPVLEPTTPPTLEPPAGAPPAVAPPLPNPPASGGATAPVLPPPGQQAAPPPGAGGTQAGAPAEESAVESQLEAQGDQQAVDNVRNLRAKLRDEQRSGRGDDGPRQDGQGRGNDGPGRGDGGPGRGDGPGRGNDGPGGWDGGPGRGDGPGRDGPGRGDDRDGRWERERPPESDIVLDLGGRFIVRFGDQIIIRQDDAYESDRFLDRARDVDVEHFPGGYSRTTVSRGDGSQIITVRDRYGDIMTRTRVDPRGRQLILIDNREFYRDGRRPTYTRFEDELPPLRIGIPQDRYIVETSRADRDQIYAALMAPPVETIERPYALDEIRMSERLRDKMPRVDLNTITFDFGSAAITPSQFSALTAVGQAMEQAIAQSPGLIFLIEGHTDAVGSDNDNLVLSDRRAEAIAVALSSNFNIPPENLVTQGYGEQYLKVPTEGPEQQNRRVTVRNITELAQGQ